MVGKSAGEPEIEVGLKGSLGDPGRRMEAGRRLSRRVACRRGNASRRQSLRNARRRWKVAYDRVRKSCTASADSAYAPSWKRGRRLFPKVAYRRLNLDRGLSVSV